MRGAPDFVCGCFPTGRHYPGIADRIAAAVRVVAGLCAEFEAAAAWAHCPFVVIDFETTGLDPACDRILEIGLVCFERGELHTLKHWLVNPRIPVPEESRAVHGITDEELAQAPYFEDIADELHELLHGRIPVAYNASFDRGFLHAEFRRLPAAPTENLAPALRDDVVWVDPLVWVRELHKYEKGKKLTDVCARLGIALEQAHRAAGDAEAAGRVLLALASQMPGTYGELVRLQTQTAARHEVERIAWRNRQS